MSLCLFVLGWAGSSSQSLPSSLNYYVNDTFCSSVLPYFREDTFLSWRDMTCADVDAAVRRSFDAWQYNSLLSFREVRFVEDAHITLSATDLNVDGRIAQASLQERVDISTHEDVCWYTDHHFCRMARQYRVLSYSILGVSWGVSVVTLVWLLYSQIRRPLLIVRLFAWTIFTVCPMVYLGALLPCEHCFDFVRGIMHEVGHAIGLQHPDGPGSHSCGCGTEAIDCGTNPDPTLIMHSVVSFSSSACLSRDDVDGVRTLHGGICADPVWCYERVTVSGLSRVAIAFVYSFLVACIVVSLRNCVDPRKTVPKVAICPAPPPRRASSLPVRIKRRTSV